MSNLYSLNLCKSNNFLDIEIQYLVPLGFMINRNQCIYQNMITSFCKLSCLIIITLTMQDIQSGVGQGFSKIS